MTKFVSISPGTQTCIICNAPLSFHQALNSKLCGRTECDWRYSLLWKQHKLCTVCGRPLSLRELSSGVCTAWECRRVAGADEARRQRERDEALEKQATSLRHQAAGSFGIRKPGSFLMAYIPASVSRITHLPARRRREFRDHLNQLIDQALASPAVEQDQVTISPTVQDVRSGAASAAACACCKGFCCQGGRRERAYLNVQTIQRYMMAHKDQGSRDVLAAYMSHVGDQTYQESCVYHRADGCSLPRDMRSDICNQFFCIGLREFRRSLPSTGPVRGFFVAIAQDAIQRAAFIHEDQILIVPVSRADKD
jgi:hypothetical protein